MSAYGDSLAKVGLTPDNPDGMYAQLQFYLTNPVGFKNADKNWRGARDNKTWWVVNNDGIARLQWPFHGGRWLDAAPKNDAQYRAVFKIPAGMSTKQGLMNAYHFPATLRYNMNWEEWKQGGGFDLGGALGGAMNAIKQGTGSVVDVANALHIPGVNLTTAILTGKNPVDALKADINSFAQAAQVAQHVTSGNMAGLTADLNGFSSKFGVQLPQQAVQAAVAIAQKGGDPTQIVTTAMGDAYNQAWHVATNGGTIFSAGLPAPDGLNYAVNAAANATHHPLTLAAQTVPLHLAIGNKAIQVPVNKAAVARLTGISPWHPALATAPPPPTSYTPVPAVKKKPWWLVGVGGGGLLAAATVGVAALPVLAGAAIGGTALHLATGGKLSDIKTAFAKK